MKVLQTISNLNFISGGPSICVMNLVAGLRYHDIDAQILTFSNKYNDSITTSDKVVVNIQEPFENRFGFSRAYRNKLKSYSNHDIFHANGLWQFTSHSTAKIARNFGIPYVISPHGMLYPEGLAKSRILKKIAFRMYQKYDLNNARVIHATCEQELTFIRDLGFKNDIAVIPNAVTLIQTSQNSQIKKKRRIFGFVGRFAPIKNLELLISAWSEIAKDLSDCELLLIGDGPPEYRRYLEEMVYKLNLKNIKFTGFLTGDLKEKVLESIDYLVLPSKSENFGMVVAEALVRKIPVIASKGTPWNDLIEFNAGWWIESSLESLKEVIKIAIELPEKERLAIGNNGYELVKSKYGINKISNQMIELYNWILDKGNRPIFVNTLNS